jgi:hypothetical protein
MQFNNITIENWAAWAPGLLDKAAWLAWSEAPQTPEGEEAIKGESIPPMIRRRCSKLSKMAIQTACDSLDGEVIDYVIFCSQHGDVSCVVSLLNNICQQQVLSPTQFTQSVHNASVGIFSIIRQLTQNTTFISSGDNTFFMGMLEALSWLQNHPKQRVLVVMFDTYMPAMYQLLDIKNSDEYAVAFLLTNKLTNNTYHVNLSSQQKILPSSLPTALAFLAEFLTKKPTILIATQHQRLAWEKIE